MYVWYVVENLSARHFPFVYSQSVLSSCVHTSKQESLDIIQTSTMVVCLDDVSPVTDEDKARNIWHGNGSNRFFDKAIQYVVAENGEAGFCGEHCMMDGTPTLKLTEWVLDNLSKNKIKLGDSTSTKVKAKELKFNVSADVKKMIDEASNNFETHAEMHDLYVAKVPFGKGLVKKCGISPDAFCQMGIQYAFNNVTGER
jgi:carnitine O-acetyltransferase